MAIHSDSDTVSSKEATSQDNAGKVAGAKRIVSATLGLMKVREGDTKLGLKVLIVALAIAVVLVPSFFAIVRVLPEHIGVVYSRFGEELPPGQILAKEGQKGVREDFLTPGWHIVNPLATTVNIEPELVIVAGKFGVQVSLVGEPLPQDAAAC